MTKKKKWLQLTGRHIWYWLMTTGYSRHKQMKRKKERKESSGSEPRDLEVRKISCYVNMMSRTLGPS